MAAEDISLDDATLKEAIGFAASGPGSSMDTLSTDRLWTLHDGIVPDTLLKLRRSELIMRLILQRSPNGDGWYGGTIATFFADSDLAIEAGAGIITREDTAFPGSIVVEVATPAGADRGGITIPDNYEVIFEDMSLHITNMATATSIFVVLRTDATGNVQLVKSPAIINEGLDNNNQNTREKVPVLIPRIYAVPGNVLQMVTGVEMSAPGSLVLHANTHWRRLPKWVART